MTDIVRFVRQLSHDLRNHLNAAELQSAYLKEIAEDAEVKSEIQRLREMISEMGSSLQTLTGLLAPAKLTLMPYDATAFLEDLRQKVAQEFPEDTAAFEWAPKGGNTEVEIDPQLLQQAMLELLRNALQHGRGTGAIHVTSETNGHELVMTLREPKAAFDLQTGAWGREPFKLVKHGHYSLGLHRVRSIIEAHGGKLEAHYDSGASALVTTVSIPLAEA